MKFPVDLLVDVSQAELQRLANNYMNDLLYSNPDSPECLTLPDSTQITIDISSVGFIPLYGSSDKQRILALFSPSDPLTAVALYLLDQWWTVDDILRTADPARDGTVEVETVGERIVLYILNRVIYRAKEMSSEEIPFLCHGEKDHAKILWNNGEAIGFYSVKPSGSLFNSNRSYQLTVMDSIFVRKGQRGKGFGLLMLEDFVLSYKDYYLGLRYPLSKSMYKVCEKYMCQYPGDTDLLWEVEGIGGPNQRTKISSKIQTMDLSVFKRLSFTEESVMITEVTEKEMIEEITTKIKEPSMECTAETVEEVTVLRATKEAELPVSARGRSSGSKRIRNMGENITEDKSEKVIRIEDIEAESPREEQVPGQQKTEIHDGSKLVQTEGMFGVSPEGNVVDHTPEGEAVIVSDKPATVLASQDVKEADVTSVPMMEGPQVVNTAQVLNNTSHDSQITVENVASEIEEPEEECQKEDTTELVVSEEAETVTKLGEVTQIEVSDEKLEETITQQDLNISTHTSDSEALKTGGTVVKAIKTARSETPIQRSQQHIKPKEGLIEETAAQQGERVLRRKTVLIKPILKRKYIRRSQQVYQELEKDFDEVAEECEDDSTAEVVEELRATEGEEQLTNEEETEKQEEALVEDTVLKGVSTELPNAADSALSKKNVDVIDESDEQKGEEIETSEIQDKQEVSDDEVEEPPVLKRRSLRIKQKVTPEPESTKESKGHQKEQEEHTDEADLEAGGFETPDEKATDTQIGEQRLVQPEETVDKTDEISTEELSAVQENAIAEEAAEDVTPSAKVNMEECKEVQEDKNLETASMTEADKEQEANDMIEELDIATTASETVMFDKALDDVTLPVAEKPQEKHTASEIPKLLKTTVVLVDLKTSSHKHSVEEAEETPSNGERAAGKELIMASEENEQTPEPEKIDKSTEQPIDVEAVVVEKEELEEDDSNQSEERAAVEKGEGDLLLVETKVLRSGIQILTASSQQQEEDSIAEKVDEAETSTFEEVEMKVMENSAIAVPLEENQSAVLEICADLKADISAVADREENLTLAEVDEAPTKGDEGKAPEEDEIEVENAEPDAVEVDKGVEETAGLTAVTYDVVKEDMLLPKLAVLTPSGDEATVSAEEPCSKEMVPKLSDLQRVTVVLVDLRNSHHDIHKEMATVDQGVPVEMTAPEEEDEQKEEGMKEEEQMAKEHGPGSPVGVEKTELEKVAEEGSSYEVEDEETDKEDGVESIDEEEAAVQVRVLRTGRKSYPVTRRRTTKTNKQVQEEEEGGEEQAEEQQQMIDQEDGERLEAKDATQQVKHYEPEMGREKVDAVILSEEQTISTETVADEDTEAPSEQLTDDGKMSDDIAVMTQATVEGEESTSISEKALFSAKDDKEKGVSEEEEATVIETRLLRGGEKTVRDTTKSKTTKRDEQDEEGAGEKSTEESQVLRKGRRSAAAPARRKSKRARTQYQPLEEEESTTTDVEENKSDETIEENEKEPLAQRDEKIEPEVEMKKVGVVEESLTEQETVEEEQSGVAYISAYGEEIPAADHDQEPPNTHEEKDTAEEEAPIVDTRVLRRGRRSASATARLKSRRTRTQYQPEEEEEGSPAEVHEKEDNSDEIMKGKYGEEPATQKEKKSLPEVEIKKVEVVVEQSATEQETAEEEESPGSETSANRQKEEIPAGGSGEEAPNKDEEEAPVVETKVLRSGGKAIKTLPSSKTSKSQEEENEQEKTVVEKSSATEEPAVETRVLRKGRRSAATIPTRKSKRARTDTQEEDEEEETTRAEEIQVEETKGDSTENNSDENNGVEPLVQTDENTEPEVEMKEGEAVVEESVTGQEDPSDEVEDMKDALTEEAAVLEKEEISLADMDETDTDMDKAERTNSAQEMETTASEISTEVVSHTAFAEEEAIVADEPVATDETPAVSGTHPWKEKAQELNENEVGNLKEQAEPDETSPTEDNTEAEEMAAASITRGKQQEQSSNEKSMGAVESASKKGNVLNLEVDTDEEVDTRGSSLKTEQNTSDEEVEPIVIGKRVLRGRTVPSVIITPRSQSRRHSSKVQILEESLSDEEENPVSAQSRRLRKRKSTEGTPARKFKRHTRV